MRKPIALMLLAGVFSCGKRTLNGDAGDGAGGAGGGQGSDAQRPETTSDAVGYQCTNVPTLWRLAPAYVAQIVDPRPLGLPTESCRWDFTVAVQGLSPGSFAIPHVALEEPIAGSTGWQITATVEARQWVLATGGGAGSGAAGERQAYPKQPPVATMTVHADAPQAGLGSMFVVPIDLGPRGTGIELACPDSCIGPCWQHPEAACADDSSCRPDLSCVAAFDGAGGSGGTGSGGGVVAPELTVCGWACVTDTDCPAGWLCNGRRCLAELGSETCGFGGLPGQCPAGFACDVGTVTCTREMSAASVAAVANGQACCNDSDCPGTASCVDPNLRSSGDAADPAPGQPQPPPRESPAGVCAFRCEGTGPGRYCPTGWSCGSDSICVESPLPPGK